MWDLSCPDWEDRILSGRSLIPDLPLDEAEANHGLGFFDLLCLPDVPGLPLMADACGPWFREIVRAYFGSWSPEEQKRHIRDFFVCVPKGQSKTTYSAGLMLAALLMNRRPRAEAIFVGPTQAISDNAYDKAVGMIDANPQLKKHLRPRDHIKTIEHLDTRAELKVRTFDTNILTGSILVLALVDELHLLGKSQHTAKILRQIRGGLEKTPEGGLIITTTMPDEEPAGAFRDELYNARKIRDGEFRGRTHRSLLPVIYELPPSIAKDPAKWGDTKNWPLVMPNLGRSVHLESLLADWETEKSKSDAAKRLWASQHLNVEVGVGMRTDGWPGADHWDAASDVALTLDRLVEDSECIVVGVDGGGLDDLYGMTVLGRRPGEIEVEEDVSIAGIVTKVKLKTKRWLAWSHAWCHQGVLERRKSIAARLQDFAAAGDLTIVDDRLRDQAAIIAVIEKVNKAGKLACVAIDDEGPFGDLVDALAEIGITEEKGQVVGVGQGYKLMRAIKTTERKLANGTLVHAPSALMGWCVGNVRIEPTATAIRATKQNAGDAKIDPVCALWDAATVMVKNPEPARVPTYQVFFA